MSRVGKTIIQLPAEVKFTLAPRMTSSVTATASATIGAAAELAVQGKLGSLSCRIPDLVSVVQDGSTLTVKPEVDTQEARSLWGTTQRNIANMVSGVDKGFTINLELSGVGYRAQVQGNNLVLQLGYSHEIKYLIPAGITIRCEKPTSIEVFGASKQGVGQVAAEIRSKRKPEPYKGKGVIRQGEFIVRKEGKKK